MFSLRNIIVVAALGLAVPAPLFAQTQNRTYEEALAELRAQFRAADVNRDDKLSQTDARNAGMERLASNFRRVDSDRDGYVTLAELEARLNDQYDR